MSEIYKQWLWTNIYGSNKQQKATTVDCSLACITSKPSKCKIGNVMHIDPIQNDRRQIVFTGKSK